MPAIWSVGCWCQENQLVAVKFEWQNAEKTVAKKNFLFVLEGGTPVVTGKAFKS